MALFLRFDVIDHSCSGVGAMLYWAVLLFAGLYGSGSLPLVWSLVVTLAVAYVHRFAHIWQYIARRHRFYQSFDSNPLRLEEVRPVQQSPERFKAELDDAKVRWSNSPISGLLQKPRNDRGVEFVLRETCSMLLGGVAVVLQMAHPFVAFGVKHHSYVYDNIVLRFVRTFEYVLGIQFGTSEQSIRAALQVRAIHSRVHGTIEEDCTGLNGPAAGTATALDTGSGSGSDIDSGSGHNSTNSGGSSDGDDLSADRLERARMPLGVPLSGVSGWPRGYVYSAYDERAALWVFATLSELAMVGADIFANGGGAAAPVLSDSESEEIYHDTKLNAGVWGISQSTFPTDWHAFRVYFGRMCASPLLCGTSTPVQRITATIMPVPLWGLIPGFHPFQSMTAVLLPDRLRIALFGPYNNALSSVLDRLQAVHFYTVVSLIYCMIPGPMRWFTEYNTRFARIELAASGKPIPSDDADIRLPMLARMGKYFGHVLVKSYLDFITPTKPQPSATANVTAAAAAS